MQKKWSLSPQNPEKCYELSNKLKISPHLVQVILNRKVDNFESYLKPRLAGLNDPFEIPGIKKAAERVISALKNKEKIMVYGDYDVDGVTGTAIITETLEYLGTKPEHYIPFRYEEGYSLNSDAIKKAKNKNISLIITTDCGISNVKEIDYANELGIDIIVTDHHNPPANLPNAAAIVNPKQIEGEHPSKDLSGAGVAFKFVWALLRALNIKDNVFLTSLLDLAALGTIADIVPLQKENRIIASAGLNIMNQRKRLGLEQLVKAAAIKGDISIRDVNFALAPRINAAGRLEHAYLSLNLLKSSDPKEAEELSEQLNNINKQRQNIGKQIKKEAFEKIELNKLYEKKVIILQGKDWHPGVIGIIASQITDTYYRPAVLISNNRGSARSVDGINIFEILSVCKELFSSFGGHHGAAGFEIEEGKYQEFAERALKKADQAVSDEQLTPSIFIDSELSPGALTLAAAKEVQLLQPFGEDNEIPVFLSKGLPLEEFKLVGADKKHIKAKLGGFDVIGFGLSHLADSIALSKSYDLVYNLECNEWNGFERVQLNLIDMRESQQ